MKKGVITRWISVGIHLGRFIVIVAVGGGGGSGGVTRRGNHRRHRCGGGGGSRHAVTLLDWGQPEEKWLRVEK